MRKEQMIPSRSAYYIFDIAELKQRIDYLKKHLPEKVRICYAVKANPFPVGEMIDAVDRFEICSPGEAKICDEVRVPTNKTVISGVYKDPEAIEEMVSASDDRIYTVESMTQFALLLELSERYGKKLPLLLRLTNDSQFGINAAEIEEIIAARDGYPGLEIRGIQFFSGTQKYSLKKYAREIRMLDALLLKLESEYDYTAEELEYGTGFPVTYFEGEEYNEEELLSGFSELLGQMEAKPAITLEIGRAIAASCGTYYTHIVDLKCNKGSRYLLTDGGMHHLVYFGQHMAMKHPFVSVVGKENREPRHEWNICGALCSMNDIMAKQIPLPDIRIGDLLCFAQTGAYCMTEGIALFLSRDLPAVYLKKEDGSLVCVRETIETALFNTARQ